MDRRTTLIALSAAVTLCAGAPAWAQQDARARQEIAHLLDYVGQSGCQFNRNGSWYSGAEARTHLLRKLDYLEGKDLVHSTEQFIELGASKSSSSGKPYQVRCGQAAATDSGPWLNAELKTLRKAATDPRPVSASMAR